MKKILHVLLFLFLLTTISSCKQDNISTTDYLDTYKEQLSDNLFSWGLGNEIISYVSLGRSYNWYIDQYETGGYASVNCGPASVEMAGRFSFREFNHTASEARSIYQSQGGWWYDSDINQALDLFGIEYIKKSISNSDDLIESIDEGRIVLINNDMSKIPYNTNPNERMNRFYSGVTGHYLIVKGYLITDLYTLFEVYDPFSIKKTYDDNTLKGINRYYESNVFINSITTWYPMVYEIIKSDE
jgi:hypothetical protein